MKMLPLFLLIHVQFMDGPRGITIPRILVYGAVAFLPIRSHPNHQELDLMALAMPYDTGLIFPKLKSGMPRENNCTDMYTSRSAGTDLQAWERVVLNVTLFGFKNLCPLAQSMARGTDRGN
jgi:hypothetical protein